MTDEEIKGWFSKYGQFASGKDHALIKAIEAIIAPQQRTWVGLDIDERAACYEKSGGNLSKFADAVEAKLREKNT